MVTIVFTKKRSTRLPEENVESARDISEVLHLKCEPLRNI